jgi:CubicO group peptidase (beta-lactamase class C family)
MAPHFAAARELLQRAIADRVFPCAVVEAGTPTRPLWQDAVGALTYQPNAPAASLDTIFDLASLTKVLATAPLAMRAIEQGALALDDRAAMHLPQWTGADRIDVTIRDLLAHCSGLPAHRELFLQHRGVEAFVQAISLEPLEYPPGTRSIYSDLGYILLGAILSAGTPLVERFDAFKRQTASAQDLQFLPSVTWRQRTAPARFDPWRGRLLIGEVDDSNAFALGGAAGHAGLFGTAMAVGDQARHLLQVLEGRAGAFGQEMARTFIMRRVDVPNSSRALGWDTMLTTSSCGTRMSPRAFGHTGFTGTSLWIDPEQGLYVVLLTNRVYGDNPEDGTAAGIARVRRAFHDAVMDAWSAR